MVLWGHRLYCHHVCHWPTSLYVLRILVGITEAGFLPGILLDPTFWFPADFRACANALFTSNAGMVMMYTLAYFCLTNTLSAISIWTPQILQSFNQGSSNITIGLLAAVPQICTILGMVDRSRHSDCRQERRHHTALPYLFAAAGWLLASATITT